MTTPFSRTGGSVADDVARHLERLILGGVYPPGARLPAERQLASEMAVSRTAVRDALARLEEARMIVRRQGSGTRVAEELSLTAALASALAVHDDEADHSAELRSVTEPGVARLAAERITAAQLARLDDIVRSSEEEPDADRSVQLDIAFHVGVAEATGNPLLLTLSELTVSWTVEERVHSHLEGEGRRLSREGHERILAALARGDAARAGEEMELHLREIGEVIRRVRDAR
ncbi:FadR/GntR family transcriptional regulator [Microbacterium betulae]|uniref:FadR/GntR family transcriptional regulator n=1 Tax=Microbacterium betulae TaxID=2981139 RepID=A0AA97I5G4_9MICO|nr:FadR/GntR family transcriptional regulator [Microbacterium sp. AB]WOF23701.1 FadR/GntR family transcriptional regulator [Microbacterium sp. AB]